ncbi:hypothetical protein PM082_004576 [Marasmius tenuissimus]|nr:hypothetical protein PM082_004576 [Marasmius tenuissimus]
MQLIIARISARKISNIHVHPSLSLEGFPMPGWSIQLLSQSLSSPASSDIVTGCIIAFSGFAIAVIFMAPEVLLPGMFDEIELDDRLAGSRDGPVLVVPRPLREFLRPKIDMKTRLAVAQLEREALNAFDAIAAGRDEEVPDYNPKRRRDVETMDRLVAARLEGRQTRTGRHSLGGFFPESNINQDRVRRRRFGDRLHGAKMSGARRRADVRGLLNELIAEGRGGNLDDTTQPSLSCMAIQGSAQVLDVPITVAPETGPSMRGLAGATMPQDVSSVASWVVLHNVIEVRVGCVEKNLMKYLQSEEVKDNEEGEEGEPIKLDIVEELVQEAQKGATGVHEDAGGDVQVEEPGVGPGTDEENGAIGPEQGNLPAILGNEVRDRAMDVLGLTGPIHGLFAKAAVIFVLDILIAVALCLLFTIGKIFLLLSVNPRPPIKLIRCLSDLLADAAIALASVVWGQHRVDSVMDGRSLMVSCALQRVGVAFRKVIVFCKLEPASTRLNSRRSCLFGAWESWKGFVTADGSSQRIFSVMTGYFVVIGGIYLTNIGLTISASQISVIVATLALVEFLVFPLTCGFALEFFIKGLLPDAHAILIVGVVSDGPVVSFFYRWVVGLMCIRLVTVTVMGYRAILCPGALWFLPPFQGRRARVIFRDMLHYKTTVQLRNAVVMGVIYIFLIGGTTASFVGSLLMSLALISPFQWGPSFSTPIGLLCLTFALPYVLRKSGFRKDLYDVAAAVSRYLAAQLRLTAYLFGRREGNEEHTRRSWVVPICQSNVDSSNGLEGYDGSFRHVPNANWPALGSAKSMYAAVAVTPAREPMDDAAKLLMLNQDAQLLKVGRSAEEDYTVVYIPPYFGCRIGGFVLSLWIVGELYLGFGIWALIVIGRTAFRLFTVKDAHDGYSVIIGFVLVWAWCVGRRDAWSLKKLAFRRYGGLLWMVKGIYVVVCLGMLTPVCLARAVELYVSIPMRLWLQPDWVPSFDLVDAWGWGMLYMVVGTRLIHAPPGRQITLGLQKIQRNGWMNLDALGVTKDVIAPLLLSLLILILVPEAVFKVAQYSISAMQLSNGTMYTHFYPGALLATVLTVSSRLSWEILVLTVREREYLIETKLKNYERNEEETMR